MYSILLLLVPVAELSWAEKEQESDLGIWTKKKETQAGRQAGRQAAKLVRQHLPYIRIFLLVRVLANEELVYSDIFPLIPRDV